LGTGGSYEETAKTGSSEPRPHAGTKGAGPTAPKGAWAQGSPPLAPRQHAPGSWASCGSKGCGYSLNLKQHKYCAVCNIRWSWWDKHDSAPLYRRKRARNPSSRPPRLPLLRLRLWAPAGRVTLRARRTHRRTHGFLRGRSVVRPPARERLRLCFRRNRRLNSLPVWRHSFSICLPRIRRCFPCSNGWRQQNRPSKMRPRQPLPCQCRCSSPGNNTIRKLETKVAQAQAAAARAEMRWLFWRPPSGSQLQGES
jgi:hypothetical protein